MDLKFIGIEWILTKFDTLQRIVKRERYRKLREKCTKETILVLFKMIERGITKNYL